ncbi:hypothetical protein PsorP6_011637 [Peronosclerospora sorghi]|uniref:Uncharacterized protein n=1 Tax=Peronosclerospora sorghi TaxID=230839 RepID=A0ACC0WK55_9STRA|nr:hypothetical protein PsorP6_011637 [Peronosclerospora sorghi]
MEQGKLDLVNQMRLSCSSSAAYDDPGSRCILVTGNHYPFVEVANQVNFHRQKSGEVAVLRVVMDNSNPVMIPVYLPIAQVIGRCSRLARADSGGQHPFFTLIGVIVFLIASIVFLLLDIIFLIG